MANLNGTGPEGKGSRTGRGLGNCGTNNNRSANTTRPHLGLGRGAARKLDGTGPEGKGPKTGRGLGNCK